MKLSTISLLAVRLEADHGLMVLGRSAAVDAERLAEGPHPQMVLVELLAPGQRPPRDQLVDVGVAGVVADLLALEPDQVGEEMILRGWACTSRKRIFSSSLGMRQVGVLAAGLLRQRLPGLDRDLAVGLRRQHQDRLGGVDIALDPGSPWSALLGDRAVQVAQELDLVTGLPGDALAAVAELVHQRPERGEALVEVGVVALDDGDLRHGLARESARTRRASSPWASNGWASSPGLSCWIGSAPRPSRPPAPPARPRRTSWRSP
jgi:hypothetical protein